MDQFVNFIVATQPFVAVVGGLCLFIVALKKVIEQIGK